MFIAAEGRDITEKKAQEREIAQKNIELQGLLERIRELDEIKTQFFANVSHELRTPLALILGPGAAPDRRRRDDGRRRSGASRRRSIARNARMLLKHVNDLLDMSKLEARKLKIELQDTDVAALVRFLASHFAVLAADRQIDYVVDADEAVRGGGRSRQAAARGDEPARQRLQVRPAGGRVRCSLRQSAAGARRSRSTTPAPACSRSCGRRSSSASGRATAASTARSAGTGLGLAIAKEFVEMHKGRIEVLDSDLGGARFEVTLPLNRLAPPTCSRRRRRRASIADAARRRDRGAARHAASAPKTRRADGRAPATAPDGRASSSSRTTPT